MTVLLALLVGYLAGRLTWLLLRPTFRQPVFVRRNYRDAPVVTAAGLAVTAAVLLVEAGRTLAEAAGVGDERAGPGPVRAATVVAVLGLCLLGLADDLAAAGVSRGFRGHLAALARGRLTTGGLKLLGGAAVCVLATGTLRPTSLGRLLLDGALVALAANLGNLLDRAPGRTTKVGGAAFVVLALAVGADTALTAAAVVVGASLALLLDDLRERIMLGDAGANVVGGALGLGVVATTAPDVRAWVLVALVVLNLASEVVSFSRVIDRIPPLRALDRAGCTPQRRRAR